MLVRGTQNTRVAFEVDYALFKLIQDIKEGYRPNVKDKNKFIAFVNGVEHLYADGDKKNEVMIQRKNAHNKEEWILKKTTFGFKFERV